MSDFWSRRKAAVEAEARAEEEAAHAAGAAETEARLAERSDEELLQELGLPAPEDIGDADTVRRYLRAALPQRLKQRALRRLWTMNPVLANLDGLVDYADDFTVNEASGGVFRTSYQVGKGLLAHVEAMAAKENEAETTEQEIIAEPETELAAAPQEAPPEENVYLPPEAEVPDPVAAAPRRMRFRFEEAGHG